MKVSLVTNDEKTVVAEVEVPGFPNDPKVVVLLSGSNKMQVFIQSPNYGSEVKYVENSFISIVNGE